MSVTICLSFRFISKQSLQTCPAKSLVSGLISRKQEIEALFLPTFRSALILCSVYLGHV